VLVIGLEDPPRGCEVRRAGQQVDHGVQVQLKQVVQRFDRPADLVGFGDATRKVEPAIRDRGQLDPIADLAQVGQVAVADGRDHAGAEDAHPQAGSAGGLDREDVRGHDPPPETAGVTCTRSASERLRR
jgi:hypothetical protein